MSIAKGLFIVNYLLICKESDKNIRKKLKNKKKCGLPLVLIKAEGILPPLPMLWTPRLLTLEF